MYGTSTPRWERGAFVDNLTDKKDYSLHLFLCVIFLLLFTSRADATTTTKALDSEITKLSGETSSLQSDVPNAIHSLMQISNLSSGALLTATVVNATQGGTVDLPISFISSTFSVTGLQADLVLPAGIALSSITAGPAATVSNKQLSSNGNRFILFGLNQIPISSGVIAVAHLSVSSTAPKSIYSIGLINPVFSDANGHAVIASTVSGSVVVQ